MSRGGGSTNLWWNRPEWLTNKEKWPLNPVTSASAASEEEAKVICEVLISAKLKNLLTSWTSFWRSMTYVTLRGWRPGLISTCRGRQKVSGPLTKTEIDDVKRRWILLVQHQYQQKPHFKQTGRHLTCRPMLTACLNAMEEFKGNTQSTCQQERYSPESWWRNYIVKPSKVVSV